MTSDNNSPENRNKAPDERSEIKSVESVPSLESKPATEADLRQVQKDMSGFERSTIRWTRANFAVVLFTGLFIGLTWYEMHAGGEDTHTLAEAARKQAEKSRIDDRAWIEIEPLKPAFLAAADDKFPTVFTCNI